MKKILLIYASLLVVLSSCFRENGNTHHHIETDEYTLTVSGQRILEESQLADIHKDTIITFGDTVTLHDDVDWVAHQIEELSRGIHSYSEPDHFRGDYILNLELIHHPGSDHAANASAALANLCDWGYIDIDTTYWQDITVVRHGTRPEDYNPSRPEHCYGDKPYSIYIPDELMSDSINDYTLEQWLQGWTNSNSLFSTNEKLFQFVTTHGYDTVHDGSPYRQIYSKATRRYR